MNKIFYILSFAVLSLSTATFLLYQRSVKLEKERNRYKENTNTLLSDLKKMQIDSVTMAVDVKMLRLTVDEYKRYKAADAEHIKKLGVEIKRLKAVAKHELSVDARIKAEVRDTILFRDTVTLTLQSITMDTPHLKVNGIIENNQLTGKILLPVNLHQAVWIEPKHKFLWWSWGVKAIHQTISSDNPYVEVTYSEVIEIQK